MNIKGQSFLKLLDFTPEQIMEFLALAAKLKAKKKAGIPHRLCEGKQAALIFEKTSTRTRCSFEVAAHDLGMTVTYLDPSGSQIGKKESIADTARVLGRMYDGIEYRGYGQQIVEDLAKYAGVPVWNGLTNEFHHTDSRRLSDDSGAFWQPGGQEACIYGRRAVQHGQLAYGRLCEDGHALYRLRAGSVFPECGPDPNMQSDCWADRRSAGI